MRPTVTSSTKWYTIGFDKDTPTPKPGRARSRWFILPVLLLAVPLLSIATGTQTLNLDAPVMADKIVAATPMEQHDESAETNPEPPVIVPPTTQSQRPPQETTISRGGGRIMRMLATAYTLECGNGDGYTATMTRPRIGVIAVDPAVIPYGTLVYIEEYGYFRAEDTGGAIRGNRIDIFMASARDAINFGRRWVEVKIIGPLDEP